MFPEQTILRAPPPGKRLTLDANGGDGCSDPSVSQRLDDRAGSSIVLRRPLGCSLSIGRLEELARVDAPTSGGLRRNGWRDGAPYAG